MKMSSYLNDDDDDDNVENTAALGNPTIALNQAMRYLTQEQWYVGQLLDEYDHLEVGFDFRE